MTTENKFTLQPMTELENIESVRVINAVTGEVNQYDDYSHASTEMQMESTLLERHAELPRNCKLIDNTYLVVKPNSAIPSIDVLRLYHNKATKE